MSEDLQRREDRDPKGEDCHVTMEAQIGVVHLSQEVPRIAARRGKGIFPPADFRAKRDPISTLITDV